MSRVNELISDLGIEDIQWKVENTTGRSLLFYKLNDDDEESYDLFIKRLSQCKFGFVYVATDKKYDLIDGVSFVPQDQWFELQEQAMDKLYPILNHPRFIGVTGTNGKTTTVDFIRQICVNAGLEVLSIGTLGVWYGDKKVSDFGLTTPNYIDLRKYLSIYNADVVCFEASSHAIVQKRFYNIELDVALWTSFSQDHLDYHKTMPEYYKAKLGLKDYLKKGAKFFFHKEDIEDHKDTSELTTSSIDISCNKNFLKVNYNKKNLELAVCALEEIDIQRLDSYEFIEPVPGRFNTFEFNNNIIVIDYAHTPDAIENICVESKKAFNKKIVTLFGCGGDRDRLKRPLMGKAACSNSDDVIITSDNPRFEDPKKIVDDIVDGVDNFKNYKIIIDRKEAIKDLMQKEDSVLLILGKGNEPYIDIKGVKEPYSDLEVVEKIINDQTK